MMSRGFKPVGWVASVAGAALGCYMLSLNVAAERAELAKIERGIIIAKQDIRSLQTELGTRGRLQQLESWNANVLALSAPTSAQFLENELTLARFERREPTVEDHGVIHMASAETAQPQVRPQSQVAPQVRYAASPAAPVAAERSLVHRASMVIPEVTRSSEVAGVAEVKKAPAKPAPAVKKAATAAKPAAPAQAAALLDDDLVKAIGDAAKAEKSGSAGGR